MPTPRKIVRFNVINNNNPKGSVLFYVAEADDGTFWQCLVSIEKDGVHFRRPTGIVPDVSKWPDGWSQVTEGALPAIEGT